MNSSSGRRQSSPGENSDPMSVNSGDVQRVVSPEQVALELPVSGPTSRMIAYGIDMIFLWFFAIALFVLAIVTLPFMAVLGDYLVELGGEMEKSMENPADPTAVYRSGIMLFMMAVGFLFMLVSEWGYFIFCEMVMSGQSIGKRVMGLRVVQDGGFPVTFRSSLIRNLMRFVDKLPSSYVTGIITIICSSSGKRLGDMAANTVVIRVDRGVSTGAIEIDTEGEDSFHFSREQIERCGASERTLVRQTLRRLKSLKGEQQAVILQRAVEVLREQLQFEEEVPASEREAFLRSILGVLRR